MVSVTIFSGGSGTPHDRLSTGGAGCRVENSWIWPGNSWHLVTSSRHWRAVIIHAYYALLLECRDAMARWKLPSVARQQLHAQVRLRFIYAADIDLKKIGDALEVLNKHRNAASYDLQPLPL